MKDIKSHGFAACKQTRCFTSPYGQSNLNDDEGCQLFGMCPLLRQWNWRDSKDSACWGTCPRSNSSLCSCHGDERWSCGCLAPDSLLVFAGCSKVPDNIPKHTATDTHSTTGKTPPPKKPKTKQPLCDETSPDQEWRRKTQQGQQSLLWGSKSQNQISGSFIRWITSQRADCVGTTPCFKTKDI